MLYDKQHALLETSIPELGTPMRGKVRDVYDLGETLLFIATDRISAYDCIMPNGIPDKGRVLTQITLNWFKVLTGMPNHLVTADVSKYPAVLQKYAADLDGRSMIVKKLKMLPVECIVRGYLSGSGWESYEKSGTVCGIRLREGYQKSSKLDEPIFTPTTKEQSGHDMPIDVAALGGIIGAELAEKLSKAAIDNYRQAADFALTRNIIIADTKFEFGLDEKCTLVLADEVLTPDSSRFWPVATYAPGKSQPSLDKQFVRDWLDSIHFNRQPPAPELPPEVVAKTTEKYNEALKLLSL
ncbi:MAG: phosphoribosylaminoimidazolesuccinocarboxamide synthase [Victivallales bacterium]|nr:phosphoribosylaminoimidazolesuccinocarboxamide synthase [Victivallales bacterium]